MVSFLRLATQRGQLDEPSSPTTTTVLPSQSEQTSRLLFTFCSRFSLLFALVFLYFFLLLLFYPIKSVIKLSVCVAEVCSFSTWEFYIWIQEA